MAEITREAFYLLIAEFFNLPHDTSEELLRENLKYLRQQPEGQAAITAFLKRRIEEMKTNG